MDREIPAAELWTEIKSASGFFPRLMSRPILPRRLKSSAKSLSNFAERRGGGTGGRGSARIGGLFISGSSGGEGGRRRAGGRAGGRGGGGSLSSYAPTFLAAISRRLLPESGERKILRENKVAARWQGKRARSRFRRRVAGLSRMRFFVALRANERIIVAFEGISRP